MHGSNTNEGTHPELGYDHRDINLRAIIQWNAIFLAFVVICIFAAMAAYSFFTPDWKKEERALPSYVTKARVPPFPQVQGDPKLDMEVFKAVETPKREALEKVKEEQAAKGISGVTGEDNKGEGHSFPGSGDYIGHGKAEAPHTESVAHPSEKVEH